LARVAPDADRGVEARGDRARRGAARGQHAAPPAAGRHDRPLAWGRHVFSPTHGTAASRRARGLHAARRFEHVGEDRRAAIRDRHADGLAGNPRAGEAAAGGRDGLGVVGGAKAAPQLLAAALAEADVEVLSQQGRAELAAAALAEDAPHERRDRHDVLGRPRVGTQRPADRRVLARELGGVELGLGDEPVDARGVGVEL